MPCSAVAPSFSAGAAAHGRARAVISVAPWWAALSSRFRPPLLRPVTSLGPRLPAHMCTHCCAGTLGAQGQGQREARPRGPGRCPHGHGRWPWRAGAGHAPAHAGAALPSRQPWWTAFILLRPLIRQLCVATRSVASDGLLAGDTEHGFSPHDSMLCVLL